MFEPSSSPADVFFAGALQRIRKYMIAASAVGLVVCLVFFRWSVAAGFLAGAIVSYVNHRWLEDAIDALGERITTGDSKERGGGIIVRAAFDMPSSPWGPMLYLMFLEQVFMDSWEACAFRLWPWPAKSQWKCLLPCGADSDSLITLTRVLARIGVCQTPLVAFLFLTSKPSCLSNFG